MNSEKPQKMIIPCIISILKEYTDIDNTMTQDEIRKKLKSNYGVDIHRKTLSRNLKTILYNTKEVECDILDRSGTPLSEEDDDVGAIYTNFYYIHMFSKVELQAIINNIVFAKHISKHHKEELIEKLESLTSFSNRHDLKNYIRDDHNYNHEFEELFYNLELIDEYITSKDIVKFQYASYKADMKLHTDKRIWYVFPLGIAEKNNDYYLVGLVCGNENESPDDLLKDVYKLIDNYERGSRYLDTFRIDKIRNLSSISESDEGFQIGEADKKLAKKISMRTFKKTWSNVQDYVSQNSSLCPGRNINAKFRLLSESDDVLSDVIDYFGKENLRIENELDGGFIITVDTNDRAMSEFAKLNVKNVEVIQPDYLRGELLELFKSAYERMY